MKRLSSLPARALRGRSEPWMLRLTTSPAFRKARLSWRRRSAEEVMDMLADYARGYDWRQVHRLHNQRMRAGVPGKHRWYL